MTANPKHPLTYRLIEAVNAVSDLEKLGKNETADYAWLRASDVARAFRKELKKRHILITSDEKEVTGRTMQTSAGPMSMITVKVDFYFHCGFTGEVIGPRCGIGQAMDRGDKGLYKAKTGALKSFLRLFSLLPDKDDPEADETVDKDTAPPQPEPTRPAPKPSQYRSHYPEHPLDLHQVKAIADGLRTSGKTEQEFCEHFAVATIRSVKRGQFHQALQWALALHEPSKKSNGAQPIVQAQDVVDKDEQLAGD